MIFLIGVVGFLSGVAGGGVAIGLLPPSPFEAIIIRRGARPLANHVSVPLPSVASVHAAVVDCFVLPANAPLPERIPRSERSGRGVVLTSDGWIVTTQLATRRLAHIAIATSDGVLHEVDRIAEDPASLLVFLHIADRTTSVLPLDEAGDLPVGALLVLPTVDELLAATTFQGYTTVRDGSAVHSTDQLTMALAFAELPDVPPGSPVISADGALVGIAIDAGHAIPARAITAALPTLFTDGAVSRNALHGAIRDRSAFVTRSSVRETGTALVPQSSGRLFSDGSALARVLLPGDVVLGIGDDPVTSRRPLPDLLQEYPIGATVTFRILRSGKEQTVDVPLERARGTTIAVDAASGVPVPSTTRAGPAKK